MDMKCMRCGEPWDWWYIRDDILPDDEKFNLARKSGLDMPEVEFKFSAGPYIEKCPACYSKPDSEIKADPNLEARSALRDILGDDIDGFLSTCEDFGL